MSLSIDFAPASSLPRSRWWHCLHADPTASIRLWCFPSIGSGTAIWRPWVTSLTGAAELMAISLPGRESRLEEAPFTRIDEVAGAIAAEYEMLSDERDVFCGHGMGGLIAFEVARRLRRDGTAGPRGLAVCGTRCPVRNDSGLLLHRLSPREFVTAVEKKYGQIPPEIQHHPDFLELLLPVLRADIEAVETYRFDGSFAPLDIPLLAIAGTNDPLIPPAALEDWRLHTRNWFRSARVTGGHFIVTENALETADRVRRFLAAL